MAALKTGALDVDRKIASLAVVRERLLVNSRSLRELRDRKMGRTLKSGEDRRWDLRRVHGTYPAPDTS